MAVAAHQLRYMMENVVINEVLCFIRSKMDLMDITSLTSICASFYKDEEIEAAQSKLRSLDPATINGTTGSFHWRNRIGEGKKKRYIEDIVSAFQVVDFGETKFVAHDLSNLPPVSFNSLDASALLAKIEKLTAEQSAMQLVVSKLVNPAKNTASQDRESLFPPLRRNSNRSRDRNNAVNGDTTTRNGSQQLGELTRNGTRDTNDGDTNDGDQNQAPASNPWLLATRRGMRNGLGKGNHTLNSKRQVIGNNNNTEFKAVLGKTSAFTTRWPNDTDPKKVEEYLCRKLNTNIECNNLNLKSKAYISLKITAHTNNRDILIDPNLWPAGVVVTRFFQPRSNKPTNSKTGLVPDIHTNDNNG